MILNEQPTTSRSFPSLKRDPAPAVVRKTTLESDVVSVNDQQSPDCQVFNLLDCALLFSLCLSFCLIIGNTSKPHLIIAVSQ